MILFIHISCISVVYNYQIITKNEFFYEKNTVSVFLHLSGELITFLSFSLSPYKVDYWSPSTLIIPSSKLRHSEASTYGLCFWLCSERRIWLNVFRLHWHELSHSTLLCMWLSLLRPESSGRCRRGVALTVMCFFSSYSAFKKRWNGCNEMPTVSTKT